MKLKLIAAVGKNNELGKNNTLPLWNLLTDFKRFKNLTDNKIVVMGERTFYSLPEKFRPLPNRRNVILTLKTDFSEPGTEAVNSIEELLEKFKDEEEMWIMGGASIYKQFVNMVDELHITHVDGDFEADVFFPEIDNSIWKKTSEEHVPKDEKNSHNSVYTIYAKRT